MNLYNYTAQKFYSKNATQLSNVLDKQNKSILVYQNFTRKKLLKIVIKKTLQKNLYYLLLSELYKFITYKNNFNFLKSFVININFVAKEGVKLPLISEFQLLKEPTYFSPVEYFLTQDILQPYREEIIKIFNNSHFTNGDRRYRSFLKGGIYVISGDNKNDIWSMSGIAHELGHCLYENDIKKKTPFILFYSELIAHLFEEFFVQDILRKYSSDFQLKCWQRYQYSIDILNLYFFILEWQAVLPNNLLLPKIFSTKALVLRESLFLLPGYQLVYAYASAWRLILRQNKKVNIVYILERLKNETDSYKH